MRVKGRRVGAALAVLGLVLAGCVDAKAAQPKVRRFAAFEPLPVTTLAPIAAEPARCPEPPRDVRKVRPPAERSRWQRVWTEELVDPEGTGFTDAGVTADGTIWAVHQEELGPQPWRWDGGRWTAFEVPERLGGGPSVVAAVSRDQAWVFGANDRGKGYAATFEGGRWVGEYPTAAGKVELDGGWTFVLAYGPWVVNDGLTLRWNGGRWQSAELGFGPNVLAGNGDEVWAVGETGAARWEGGAWRAVGLPVTSEGTAHFFDAAVLGDGQVWVFGMAAWEEGAGERVVRNRQFGLRFAKGAWHCVWDLSTRQAEPDGRGGMWLVGADDEDGDELWHLSGDGRWTRQRLPVPRGSRAWVSELVLRPGGTEVYAVGTAGRNELEAAATLWRTG